MEKNVNIVYKDLSENGPMSEIKELSNELFQLQAERATKYKEILANMNYESRGVENNFNNAKERFLLVAYDGEKPIGYVFCDAGEIPSFMARIRPSWIPDYVPEGPGLYPDNLDYPVRCGHIGNLYVKDEYRGLGIGKHFMESAMAWLKQVPDLKHYFVHVSNNNNVVPLYEKYGFKYDHDVFDGLIWCLKQDVE